MRALQQFHQLARVLKLMLEHLSDLILCGLDMVVKSSTNSSLQHVVQSHPECFLLIKCQTLMRHCVCAVWIWWSLWRIWNWHPKWRSALSLCFYMGEVLGRVVFYEPCNRSFHKYGACIGAFLNSVCSNCMRSCWKRCRFLTLLQGLLPA